MDTISKYKDNRFGVSLLMGTSVPLGNFSYYAPQSAYDNTLSGSPKIGFSIKINTSYLFIRYHFGVMLSFLSSCNRNYSEYEGFYYRIPSGALGSYIHWDSYIYKSSNWYFNSLLAGIFVEPIRNPKISLRFWLSGGLLRAICPATELNQSGEYGIFSQPPNPFTENFVQPQMFSNKFALNSGTCLSVRIIRNFNALISFDFLASDAIFHGNVEHNFYSSEDTYYRTTQIRITNRVYMLYCNAGFAYFFN